MQCLLKNIHKIILTIIIAIAAFGCDNHDTSKKIAIIIPMEHQALSEIISGFESTLTKEFSGSIKFKIANAQGDINLQRAIIAQLRDEQYDMLVPITTSTAAMASAMVKQQPLVALAADIPASKNSVVVDDEIDKHQILNFIHAINPKLTNLTLIHSAADKIFSEVRQLKTAAPTVGINLHEFLVQNLADLYSVTNAIPNDAQAIYILKDNLIASGVDTLIKIANARHIPLITSDDGTVKHGASYALGVDEKQIGVAGGKAAAKVLAGTKPITIPIIKLTTPTVFINSKVLPQQGVNLKQVQQAAAKLHYPLVDLNEESQK